MRKALCKLGTAPPMRYSAVHLAAQPGRAEKRRCNGGRVLRDEGEAYARKLKEAGVNVETVRYNSTIHDFVLLNALRNLPSTEAAIEQVKKGLRQHLKS